MEALELNDSFNLKGSNLKRLLVNENEPKPTDHRMQYSYVLSYFIRPRGKFDPVEYSNYVQPVAVINSVEQFWSVFLHLKKPIDLADKSDIHFFKKGIKPVWEDPANTKGGKWIIRLKKGICARIWENVLLALIGEQFMVGDEICGAVCSIRSYEDIISIWNRSDEPSINNRIRNTLRKLLSLPQNTILVYKRHHDCLKDQSSYRFTSNTFKC